MFFSSTYLHFVISLVTWIEMLRCHLGFLLAVVWVAAWALNGFVCESNGLDRTSASRTSFNDQTDTSEPVQWAFCRFRERARNVTQITRLELKKLWD